MHQSISTVVSIARVVELLGSPSIIARRTVRLGQGARCGAANERLLRESHVHCEPTGHAQVTDVDVQPDPLEAGRVLINIQYLVKSTNDEVNMVYPFYLIPTEV